MNHLGSCFLRHLLSFARGLALAAGLAGLATPALAMTFQLVKVGTNAGCRHGCAEVITADGEITNDTAQDFVSFLYDHLGERGLRPVVLLQSPGGTVVGAMQLGTVFRRIGAAVMVASAREAGGSDTLRLASANCLSACVYAFMGGKKRIVPNVSRLGIHRMVIEEHSHGFFGGEEVHRVFGSQDFVATLSAYTRSMGVSPAVIAYAEQVPPEAIHILTPSEIRRWRLASTRP